MPIITFSPSTTILSADHNANNAGLADGSNDTTANSLSRTRRYSLSNHVWYGLVAATSATLSSTISTGEALINGKWVNPVLSNQTYVASNDTYIDLKDDGTYVKVAVANNATTGMTLTLNSDSTNALRIAKVVTSATAVTSVVQYGIDPLANYIYNMSPVAAPISMFVNTGAGLGTFYYRNQAGVKELWGTTGTLATSITPVAFDVNLPTGFFNSIMYYSVTAGGLVTTASQVGVGNSCTLALCNGYAYTISGTGSANMSFYIRGF